MTDPPAERRRGMEEVQQELAALRGAVEGFASAAERMVPKEDFDRGRRELFIIGGAVALIVVTIGFFNLLTMQGQDDVLNRLEDCTTPTGQCYQNLTQGGEGRNAEVVKAITTRLDTIRCLLLILPENRTGDAIAPCLNGGVD